MRTSAHHIFRLCHQFFNNCQKLTGWSQKLIHKLWSPSGSTKTSKKWWPWHSQRNRVEPIQSSLFFVLYNICLLRRLELNQLPPGYEPDELPMLYPALLSFSRPQIVDRLLTQSLRSCVLPTVDLERLLLFRPYTYGRQGGWEISTLIIIFHLKLYQSLPDHRTPIACLGSIDQLA